MITTIPGARSVRCAALIVAAITVMFAAAHGAAWAQPCPTKVLVVDSIGILDNTHQLYVEQQYTPGTNPASTAEVYDGSGTYAMMKAGTLNIEKFAIQGFLPPAGQTWPLSFQWPSFPGLKSYQFFFTDSLGNRYSAAIVLTYDTNGCPIVEIVFDLA